MDLETLRTYTLSKKAVTEDMPFGEDTLVFRVLGKIFALTSLDTVRKDSFGEGCRVNLKCDPDYAIELREQYDDITPGFHMNKKHWNTVICDNALDDKFIKSLIDHSYDMVVKSLPKAQRLVIGC
jgi:predicted DNA-binding protein (MmcQ/YjbR family)